MSFSPQTCELELELRVSWDRPQGRVNGYDVRLVETDSSSAGEVFALDRVEVRKLRHGTIACSSELVHS